MRRLEIAVLFVLGVVGGSVGSAWYFHQSPIRTDKAAVTAMIDETLAKQPKPTTDANAVAAIVAEVLDKQPKPALDTAGVQSIVSQMLAAEDATNKQNSVATVASLDPKSLDPIIENYLMSDPQILQRMSEALDKHTAASAALKNKQAIADNAQVIFNDPDNAVLGNPKGDVTLVEMFDYNCSYCRGALPDLAALLQDDKNLKVELKQFPILSAGSVDAARIAVQVAKSGADYWAFHQGLFTGRGEVTLEAALNEAKTLGLDPAILKAGMQAPAISQALQKSYTLAKSLNVTGTPTYIIGDTIIPGAVPLDTLKAAIANMRACGSAVSCPNAG
jgi:protein-disulfide isomerase